MLGAARPRSLPEFGENRSEETQQGHHNRDVVEREVEQDGVVGGGARIEVEEDADPNEKPETSDDHGAGLCPVGKHGVEPLTAVRSEPFHQAVGKVDVLLVGKNL